MTCVICQKAIAFICTEEHSLRAPSQAGFRPGLSVLHQAFALQQLIDRQRSRHGQLFVCQLDLRGAYDRVSRPLLLEMLGRLGVHGRILAAIKALYATASVAVNVGGRLGPVLPSKTGVRQGCPLSPTLFGLLADGLHYFLRRTVPEHGIELDCGTQLLDLCYADDVLLVSAQPHGLQAEIDAAVAWCTAVGMQVSVAKTVCLELVKGEAPVAAFRCAEQELEFVAETRYLGLHFGVGAGLLPTCAKLLPKFQGAWARLRRQYLRLDLEQSVWLLMRLYQARVVPVASFGSELWGVYPATGELANTRKRLASVQLDQVRQLAGLRATTPTLIVYAELGLLPCNLQWLLAAARFYNSLLSASRPYSALLLDSVQLARGGRPCWARGLLSELGKIGYVFDFDGLQLAAIDIAALRHRISMHQDQVWEGLDICPRTAASAGARLCTYLRYFARPPRCHLDVLAFRVRPSVLKNFLRFRTTCHGLAVDSHQRGGLRLARQDRCCSLCGAGPGDELHMIFECPALTDLRDQHAYLFASVSSLVAFIWQEPLCHVARYVDKCLRRVQRVSPGVGQAVM